MKIVIQPAARQDILDQFFYLFGQGVEDVADRFIDGVNESVATLAKRPTLGSPKKLKNPRLHGLRRWPVAEFPVIRIYYITKDDELRIIRVLHGKRDVDQILGEE